MNQILKQAVLLKQKGIILLAVQASKIDEEMLNQWVKKSNTPFSIGIIQSDIEKTKFAWGVRSLPWLILTNYRRLVVDAGFGLSELNEKIEAAR